MGAMNPEGSGDEFNAIADAVSRKVDAFGVERQKVREMVERLVSWVEQFAGEDLPVTLEARTWLDKDWGQTLPKEARTSTSGSTLGEGEK